MAKWNTVLPLPDYYIDKDLLTSTFSFDEKLSLSPIPDWVKEENMIRSFNSIEKDGVIDSSIVYIYDYEAELPKVPGTLETLPIKTHWEKRQNLVYYVPLCARGSTG